MLLAHHSAYKGRNYFLNNVFVKHRNLLSKSTYFQCVIFTW
nr:MAG TPA: hypothetical protein [Caudoviricetes sp.]